MVLCFNQQMTQGYMICYPTLANSKSSKCSIKPKLAVLEWDRIIIRMLI